MAEPHILIWCRHILFSGGILKWEVATNQVKIAQIVGDRKMHTFLQPSLGSTTPIWNRILLNSFRSEER